MASIKINPKEESLRSVLPILLVDRTTGKNIIFATESYRAKGLDYGAKSPITEEMLLLPSGDCFIQLRVLKERSELNTIAKEQTQRSSPRSPKRSLKYWKRTRPEERNTGRFG